MAGINKSGNTLTKDFIGSSTPTDTMSFTYTERVANVLDKKDKMMPPGSLVFWLPGFFTNGSNAGFTPVQYNNYNELVNSKIFYPMYRLCDGSICDDTRSSYYGKTLPNLTDERFLMGSDINYSIVGPPSESGSYPKTSGGNNFIPDHTHTHSLTGSMSYSGSTGTHSGHGVSPSGNPVGDMGYHRFQVWNSVYLYSSLGPYTIGDDNYEGSAYLSLSSSGSHQHIATGLGSAAANALSHTHSHAGIAIAGTVGSGTLPNLTDSRPIFLGGVFLIKVL